MNEVETLAPLEELNAPPRARSRIWMIRLASMIVVTGAWEVIGRRVNPLFMSRERTRPNLPSRPAPRIHARAPSSTLSVIA